MTSSKGEPLPPTSKKTVAYNFMDPNKNKTGKKEAYDSPIQP